TEGKVVVAETINLSPFTTKNVRIKFDKFVPKEGQIYKICKSKDIEKRLGLEVEESFIVFDENLCEISLSNIETKEKLLLAGTVVATYKEAEENDLKNERNNVTTEVTVKTPFKEGFVYVGSSLNTNEQKALLNLLTQFSDRFSFSNKTLGICTITKCKIDTGEAQPVHQTPYRYSLSQREEIERQIQDLIEIGVVRPTKSPWSCPVVLVKKKDGSMRMCVDLRKVNSLVKADVYPLPNINDALTALQGSTYYALLDLNSGYWQIPIEENDCEKTAFITQDGLYEFTYLPFELKTVPSLFQRTMDTALHGLKWNSAIVCIDDIIVFAPTFELLLERLREVLKRLEEANLTLKPSKCIFGVQEIAFLGHVVAKDGIKMDPQKVTAFSNENDLTACIDKYILAMSKETGFHSNATVLQRRDPAFTDIYWAIKDPERAKLEHKELAKNYILINDVLYYQGPGLNPKLKFCVPEGLISEVLYACHDDPMSGHLEIKKTLSRIKERFYWPGMEESVHKYVKSCMECQTKMLEQLPKA
ncbi:Retrovirus-related Pol polyprotein from transposon 17.6-like protein, partial [Dinothrombium tinctorium]